MTRRIRGVVDLGSDLLRALLAVLIIGSATYLSAQTPFPTGSAADGGALLQWGLTQGGALAVLIIVLFFYRRDWKTAVEFWRDQLVARDTLVKEATRAQVDTAAALREATIVIHGLKRVLQQEFPGRRVDDVLREIREDTPGGRS